MSDKNLDDIIKTLENGDDIDVPSNGDTSTERRGWVVERFSLDEAENEE